jgi:NAD(P)-dependent dehydrogenase (short-subunit alcohol dehydrogenase family)
MEDRDVRAAELVGGVHQDNLTEVASSCDGPTLTLPADITDGDAVDNLFDEVEGAWGPVEVLVANAAPGTPRGSTI